MRLDTEHMDLYLDPEEKAVCRQCEAVINNNSNARLGKGDNKLYCERCVTGRGYCNELGNKDGWVLVTIKKTEVR